MATYKIDIEQKYGKLYKRLYKSSEKPQDFDQSKDFPNIHELLKSLDTELEALKYDDDDDSIIFRGIAYNDLFTLKRIIRDASF